MNASVTLKDFSSMNDYDEARKTLHREVRSHWIDIVDNYNNVTLVVEMKDKDFTSHKAKFALQFGTNIFMVGLSLTFKS